MIYLWIILQASNRPAFKLTMAFSPSSTAWLAIAAVSTVCVYFFFRLTAHRRFYQNNDLPQAPHDSIWGHLKIIGEYSAKIKGDYMQAAWTQMKQDFKLPDIFYLDLWPFGPEFIICSGADAAAFLTTTNSFPQADVVADFFAHTVGKTFIEATNGPLWKELHQMLAPGLTPAATKTYHHLIVDEAKMLYDQIRRLAISEQVADLNFHLGRYPFSVIWQIFFGARPQANSHLYEDAKRLNDISGATRTVLNPLTKWQEKREQAAIIRRLEREIEKIIRSRFSKLQTEKTLPTKANASCLLDRMLLNQVQAGLPLDDGLMRLIQENAKGFLVAGYGTTTDTSSYIFMLLWAFPDALRKLREEHDRVFDKDFEETLRLLREEPGRTRDLHYTTAAIQETLRLFPIGVVCRNPPPGMTSFEYEGRTYPVRNHQFAVLGHSIHYDPEVFDDPKEFRPERFLTPDPTFPRSGYRPFERGLRSCMGQTLAMEEMKIVLLMLARWFDFELMHHNPVAEPRVGHTNLDTILGDHAFQNSRFSAGPNGDVKMKVRLAPKSG
ncbi:hypothetical protein VTI74DRAFT_5194 [Chaetomium olivicolor]